jgi:hypothetical protein
MEFWIISSTISWWIPILSWYRENAESIKINHRSTGGMTRRSGHALPAPAGTKKLRGVRIGRISEPEG